MTWKTSTAVILTGRFLRATGAGAPRPAYGWTRERQILYPELS